MAQDFARKRKPASRTSKAPARKKSPPRKAPVAAAPASSGWRWYLGGLATGIVLSFLVYLGTLPPAPGSTGGTPAVAGATPTSPPAPKPRFDFYTMLPEQTTATQRKPVEPGEPAQVLSNPRQEYFLLQAGSFKQREDADRRRAELLLLGLEPTVEESNGDNGRWFRVYLGPFEAKSSMTKARSLTAAQDIDTLLLKRKKT